MRLRSTWHASFAFVASFTWFTASPVRAQLTEQSRQINVVYELAPVGLGTGETLRYSWANLGVPVQDGFLDVLHISVRLLGTDGGELAQESADAVGPGRFQFFDFKRRQLLPTGDTNTRPLLVRVEVRLFCRSSYPDLLLKRGVASLFDDAIEVFDDESGATSVHKGGGLNELSLDDTAGTGYGNPGSFQIISAGRDHLVGLAPGQSLRLSASSPVWRGGNEREFKPLFAFTVKDLDGRVLAGSKAVALEPGQSRSFTVTYAELAPNPSLTGRVQVHVEMRRYFSGTSQVGQALDLAPASLELVDIATGRTVLFIAQKPKEIVVVGPPIER